MNTEKGTLTVRPENIFPIIKKALYAEREVFLRELISNSSDACNKLKIFTTANSHSIDDPLCIDIRIDRFGKSIVIEDNGIGMTKEEVKKYICEIAFSSAKEFIEQYQTTETLIGCFGLGFFSAFLVASEIYLDTKSCIASEQSCQWSCAGDINFTINPSTRNKRGTSITLVLDSDNYDLLNSELIEQMIKKHSDFVRYPIYLNGQTVPVNSLDAPLYRGKNELTSQDYLVFYHKLFPNSNDSLFSIHISIDYPLEAKGIIYFPDNPKNGGDIRLYSKRVFIQDNCQNLFPKYLNFLNGVVDIEGLPLIVSRDRFQEDSNIKKMRSFFQKKIAEKIRDMARTKRADFFEFWLRYKHIMKQGALIDDKWFSEIKTVIMFTSSRKKFTTLKEYLERGSNKYSDTVYYLTDHNKQGSYLEIFNNRNIEVLFLDDELKLDYLLLEKYTKFQNGRLKLRRIDTEDSLKQSETFTAEQIPALESLGRIPKKWVMLQ